MTYSQNDTTSTSSPDQSKDPGWLKNMFVKNVGNVKSGQPGFPMKSDFNVPTDGLPATTIKSRKAGRSLRWGDGVELIFFLRKRKKKKNFGWKKIFRNFIFEKLFRSSCQNWFLMIMEIGFLVCLVNLWLFKVYWWYQLEFKH